MIATDLSPGVRFWWLALCVISLLNLTMWLVSAASIQRESPSIPPETRAFERSQLLLSLVFVLGCGFRSFLPRADVQRICLVDSWFSSVMVGRSVATAAELCFVAQWALLLYDLARRARVRYAEILSRMLVPTIAFAEICSWYAVLTTCYLGNVIEESTWALTVLALSIGGLTLLPRAGAKLRPLLAGVVAVGAAYFAFMAIVDVPMYFARWRADVAAHHVYVPLWLGVRDAFERRVVTGAWQAWREEIPWMTLYFSIAVWLSIGLTQSHRFVHKNQLS